MYLHNAFEQQYHLDKETDAILFMDKLARAFEFYEEKRASGDIQFYGMATWNCFRAKYDEEGIYLRL